MSRRIFFTLLFILISLPLAILVPKVFAQVGSYNASGYVCDDLNANSRCEPNEPGIPGMMVYADNTLTGQRAYTDTYGYWQLNNLPSGAHSIEIANAGSGGSKPTTSEKFLVSGSTSSVQFGVQKGGYGVDGYVKDPYGRPVVGTTVYVDLPNRQTAVTDGNGYYRFEDIGYDSSTPVYGVSGGHSIYVQDYNSNPQLVNPQQTTTGIHLNDFRVTTDQSSPSCGPSYARDPIYPSNCTYFPSRCLLPAGWQEVSSCTSTTPPPGQCTQGQSAGTTQRCIGQQSCSVPLYYYSNCTTYEGAPTNCQNIFGQCGYYSGYSGSLYSSDAYLPDQQPAQVQPVIPAYDPASVYDYNYQAPASWTNSSWESGNGSTWYDQSTPYIAPDVEYWY